MNTPRKPMRINVGFLIKSPIGVRRTFEFTFEQIQLVDLNLTAFSGLVSVDRTQQGLLVQGTFEAEELMECVRCLDPFSQRLKWSFSELFAFNEGNASDSGLLVPENAQIDLEPLLREYALLEIPIKPICKPDCRGLCPVCGENLNHIHCGHVNLDNPEG